MAVATPDTAGLSLPRQSRPVSRAGAPAGPLPAATVAPSDWDDGSSFCSQYGVDPSLCQTICGGGFGSVPEGLCQPTYQPDWSETNTGW
jgi:hypothetical protein